MVAIPWKGFKASSKHLSDGGSNSNDMETKANVSFDNDVFFYIDAKQTRFIVRKLFLKRSEHIQ
jgi:hypothetical protein